MKSKTVAKPVVATAVKVPAIHRTRAAKAQPAVKFCLSPIARPVSGARMYAHTMAVLSAFGLFKKSKTVARHLLVQTLGERAVRYHLQELQSLALTGEDACRLTEDGVLFFTNRADSGRVRSDLVEVYTDMLVSGKENPEHGVYSRNIQPIAA